MSLAQSSLSPEDPTSKKFSSPSACSLRPSGTATPKALKLGWYACDLRVWDRRFPPFDLQVRANFFASFHAAARATCHVPPIDPRQAPPSFRRFDASIGATPVPIGPAVRAPCPEMLGHTHRHTDKHDPANFFSPTHRRKSSFIRTCYAKALAPSILYDFGLEAGIAKHCLGPKS